MALLASQAVATHGNDTRSVIDTIVKELKTQFPVYTISNSEEWIFNNAGGAMGAMYLIHASITEYLIVFGTPLGTEGHTGRHTADDYFHICKLVPLVTLVLTKGLPGLDSTRRAMGISGWRIG